MNRNPNSSNKQGERERERVCGTKKAKWGGGTHFESVFSSWVKFKQKNGRVQCGVSDGECVCVWSVNSKKKEKSKKINKKELCWIPERRGGWGLEGESGYVVSSIDGGNAVQTEGWGFVSLDSDSKGLTADDVCPATSPPLNLVGYFPFSTFAPQFLAIPLPFFFFFFS